MAIAHAQAERILKEIAVPHVVLRMPFVYGVGDRLGLFPRILCAAVYRRLGEKVRKCTPYVCTCAILILLCSIVSSGPAA
jgi:hypothetical protein